MKKILISENQLVSLHSQLMNELLTEAQLDGHHAQELLNAGFKRQYLDAIVEKFLAQDPNLNESTICFYIRRFELIKKLDTRKKIEKRHVEDYDWKELVDFVDTRINYYQKNKKKHDEK